MFFYMRRVSSKTLLGSALKRVRHFRWLCGIKIVNAKNLLFGISVVNEKERVELLLI